jgi:hypothetical protein
MLVFSQLESRTQRLTDDLDTPRRAAIVLIESPNSRRSLRALCRSAVFKVVNSLSGAADGKRAAGIEPAYQDWKSRALPLSYARDL